MSNLPRTLLVMAGGTGGHIFPALAVADYLAGNGWRIVWLGTRAGMEARLIPQRGYPLEWVSFAGLRGKGVLRAALLPVYLLWACLQSTRVLLRRRPDVVLGMGGFASFPGGLMASLLHRPLVIHEQNAIAGLANRVLAVVADRVLAGFPRAFEAASHNLLARALPRPGPVQVTGNPVRPEIARVAAPEQRYAGRHGSLRLLVVGGSLGAQVFNATVPRALQLLPRASRPQVIHQSGSQHFDTLRDQYQSVDVQAELVPFLDDMAERYAACDVLLCRAGALTVAEIAVAGVAAILVPFPSAVDDHQSANARFLSDHAAAVLLPQSEFTAARLAELLFTLTREQLLTMACAARALGQPEAVTRVARSCAELAP